jgi:hypothetical protein
MTAQWPSGPQAPPGWYPAPEGPYERWWDGYQWTPHARPLSILVPTRLSTGARAAGWLIVVSGLMIVIGAMLPWASFGPFTVAGTSGDGGITLVLGLIAIAAGVGRGVAHSPSGWQLAIAITCLVLGAIVTLIGLIDAGEVSDVVTVGSGLVLTIVGGLALTTSAIVGLVKQR